MRPVLHHRRGVALLMALLALSIVSAAAVAMLRAGTDASLAARSRGQQAQCEVIIESLTPYLVEWLSTPPKAEERDTTKQSSDEPARLGPGMNTVMNRDFRAMQVKVDAIDLSGCLHTRHLDAFAADGLTEPLRVLRAADFDSKSVFRRRPRTEPDIPPVLAEAMAVLAAQRAGGTRTPIDAFPPRDETENAQTLTVAEQLTSLGDGALNVRTAPLPILEAALHGRDPSAAAQLLDLRRAEQPIPDQLIASLSRPAEADRSSARDEPDRYVPLTGRSSAVGFLIRIDLGGSLRRWWIACELVSNQNKPARWIVRESRRID